LFYFCFIFVSFLPSGFLTVDIGAAYDQMENKLIELRDNPALLRDRTWNFFNSTSNPYLHKFFEKLKTRTKKTYGGAKRLRWEVEQERAYAPLSAAMEERMNEITVIFCEEALKKFYVYAPHLLTSKDGYMSKDKITPELREKFKDITGNNITCESVFAMVGARLLASASYNMESVNGIVIMKLNGGFSNRANIPFVTDDFCSLIMKFAKKYAPFFRKLDEQKKLLQEMATRERLLETDINNLFHSVAAYRKAIAIFGLSYTLKHIKTPEELQTMLNETTMNQAKKLEILKFIIHLEFFAYRKDVVKEMTKKGDPLFGKLSDLTDRCNAILETVGRTVPTDPPIYESGTDEEPFMPTEQYRSLINEQTLKVKKSHENILQTHLDHCLKLSMPYKDLEITDFEAVPLKTSQREFKVGRRFTNNENGIEWVVDGLVWDTLRRDYAVFYHNAELPQPTAVSDEAIKRTNFISYNLDAVLKPGINDMNVVWI
jgi:hypothetical protein